VQKEPRGGAPGWAVLSRPVTSLPLAARDGAALHLNFANLRKLQRQLFMVIFFPFMCNR